MNNYTIILILGLSAALSYGIADFFGAKASKRLGPITAAFCVQVITTLLYVMGYFVLMRHMPDMSASALMYTIGGAILMAIGTGTLYMAFETGPVSLVSPLSAAYPLVTALVGLLFFHAQLGLLQTGGILLVVVGIMATAGIFNVTKTDRRLSKGPLLALCTTFTWGLSYPLLDHAVSAAGWQSTTLIEFCLITVILGIMLWFRRRKELVTRQLMQQTFRNVFVIGAGAILLVAFLAVNAGLAYDAAAGSIIVTISSAYPAITILLALRHFKEHIEKLALLGAGLTVTGVVLLMT